jgi:hypothetical protein
MLTIKMDFVGDWARNIEMELTSLGFAVPGGLSPEELCHRYLNLRRRLVPQVPRRVFTAQEFTCPPCLVADFEAVRRKVEVGEDLRPHLSRGFMDLDSHDMLLNDWGIHHLHLGTKIEADGFVERTGPVLFVRFSAKDAYLLSVLEHGSWARQDFVRVLHRNWPDTISMWRLRGVAGLAPEITDEDVATLRSIKIPGEKKKRAAVSTFVEVEPGVVYAPIGGGYSTAQTSIVVVRGCDRLLQTLQQYEDAVRSKVQNLVDQAKSQGIPVGDELSFRLRKAGSDVVAIEENTKVVLPLSGRGATGR